VRWLPEANFTLLHRHAPFYLGTNELEADGQLAMNPARTRYDDSLSTFGMQARDWGDELKDLECAHVARILPFWRPAVKFGPVPTACSGDPRLCLRATAIRHVLKTRTSPPTPKPVAAALLHQTHRNPHAGQSLQPQTLK